MTKNPLLIVALLTTSTIALWGIVDTPGLAATASFLIKVQFTSRAWFIMLTVSFMLIVSAYLAFSRYGDIVLGKDDDKPEFSTISWLSMLFAAGMGVGLLYWGTAEPLTHYLLIAEVQDPREAANSALFVTNFHWGLHAWAIYALTGLVMAYFSFRLGCPSLVTRTVGWLCDLLAIVAIAIGVGGSVAMGVFQIKEGVDALFGLEGTGLTLSLSIFVILCLAYLPPLLVDLSRGMAVLSNAAMATAGGLMIFILIAGPTHFIMGGIVQGLGDYLGSAFVHGFRTFTFMDETATDWFQSWTLNATVVPRSAPSTPIQRGMAGAGLLSHILVSKYDDHLPLYRQGEIFARLGIDIPRSTLISWTGSAIAELRPIAEVIRRSTLTATHLHCDDTKIPVLAPKTEKTKTGYIWVVVRDGRHYQGADPPTVVYFYSPDRKGEHPRTFMEGFSGVLQADGFTGFNAMYKPDPMTQEVQVKEAGCWAHWRRKFFDFHKSTCSPIAKEALDRIGKLYDIERTIKGKTKDQRRTLRNTKSRPLTESLKTWLEARLKELPEKFELTTAINYGLSKWDAFTLFLDDPAVAIDNNAAERAMRPLCVGRKKSPLAAYRATRGTGV